MPTRLPYSTTGGQVSEADTFAQLTEYLRLAEEAAYVIGHLRKANDDNLTGTGFLGVGQMLAKVRSQVVEIMTNKPRLMQ